MLSTKWICGLLVSVCFLSFLTAVGKAGDLQYTDDISQFSVNWYGPEGCEVTEDAPPGLVLPIFTGDAQIYGKIPLL